MDNVCVSTYCVRYLQKQEKSPMFVSQTIYVMPSQIYTFGYKVVTISNRNWNLSKIKLSKRDAAMMSQEGKK